jgi:hypothetical protein
MASSSSSDASCFFVSLGEFAGRCHNQDTRVRVTEDGLIAAIDLVMVATGKNRNDAGLVLRRLKESYFSAKKIMFRSFPGQGSSKTKVITFEHAIQLIMVLPGKFAKQTRVRFAHICTRYLGGDLTLINEMAANAESQSAIAWLARACAEGQQEETKKLIAAV